jgi:hypothetical protein
MIELFYETIFKDFFDSTFMYSDYEAVIANKCDIRHSALALFRTDLVVNCLLCIINKRDLSSFRESPLIPTKLFVLFSSEAWVAKKKEQGF